MGRARGDEEINDFWVWKLVIMSFDLLVVFLCYTLKIMYNNPSNWPLFLIFVNNPVSL